MCAILCMEVILMNYITPGQRCWGRYKLPNDRTLDLNQPPAPTTITTTTITSPHLLIMTAIMSGERSVQWITSSLAVLMPLIENGGSSNSSIGGGSEEESTVPVLKIDGTAAVLLVLLVKKSAAGEKGGRNGTKSTRWHIENEPDWPCCSLCCCCSGTAFTFSNSIDHGDRTFHANSTVAEDNVNSVSNFTKKKRKRRASNERHVRQLLGNISRKTIDMDMDKCFTDQWQTHRDKVFSSEKPLPPTARQSAISEMKWKTMPPFIASGNNRKLKIVKNEETTKWWNGWKQFPLSID